MDTSHSTPPDLRGRRILLCTESFGPVNGVSRTTRMLVDHLRALGANVAVVAPDDHTHAEAFTTTAAATAAAAGTPTPPPSPPLSPSLAGADNVPAAAAPWNQEVRLRGFPLPVNPELAVAYPVQLATLYARAFGGHPPDLIYLASPASLGFQVLLQLRADPAPRPVPVPVLVNFQTDLSGYCALLLRPRLLGALAAAVLARVEGALFRSAAVRTVFYPSRAVRRYLAAAPLSLAPDRLQHLPRGVRADVFHPGHASAELRKRLLGNSNPEKRILLLCVARLAGEKGFGFLASVCAALDRRRLPFTLHIVGGNRSAAVEQAVRDLFKPWTTINTPSDNRVVFAGCLTGDALTTAYATADVFLHASVTETFGLVVLEAMASGLPVVARDAGGPSDTVRHGRSGVLVPPADMDGFADAVVRLARDTPLRQRMAAAARAQACAASWAAVNNTAAWRIREVLDEEAAARKARGLGGGPGGQPEAAMVSSVLLQTAAMALIFVVWAIVGVVLVLLRAVLG